MKLKSDTVEILPKNVSKTLSTNGRFVTKKNLMFARNNFTRSGVSDVLANQNRGALKQM